MTNGYEDRFYDIFKMKFVDFVLQFINYLVVLKILLLHQVWMYDVVVVAPLWGAATKGDREISFKVIESK